MLELGRYRLASVLAGTFAIDGGALFGIIPKPLWEKRFAADDRNRIRLAARCLLVVDTQSSRRILVDDGLGQKWDARGRDFYAIDDRVGLEEALALHRLRREDLTDVVLTHLHFDHAGGTTRPGPRGIELAFPNAIYHLQRRNWQWAHTPTEKDAGSYLPDDFELLQHTNRLHLVEGEGELFPDFELIVSEGHTVGQQLPRIRGSDASEALARGVGDLAPGFDYTV
jgi:glyoxylase-like metal-dependent hydrolase (beta-lactamase superfamily II)